MFFRKSRQSVVFRTRAHSPKTPAPLCEMRLGGLTHPGVTIRHALLFSCLLCVDVHAQPSFPAQQLPTVCLGDVDASTSPGAARCVTIAGSLRITGDLQPAFTDAYQAINTDSTPTGREPSPLTEIQGDLVVTPDATETSLRGAFVNLERVGGSVVLKNTKLVVLAVFPSLLEVGSDVIIVNNERLLRLGDNSYGAFPVLREVGGEVLISENKFVEEFQGFESLRTVLGIKIENNLNLKSIAPKHPRIGERIRNVAMGVTKPENVNPFPNLVLIAGDVSISGNEKLEEIEKAFPHLRRVDGSLTINGNPELKEIEESFNVLDVVQGGFTITSCLSLESIKNSFTKMRLVIGDFLLANNFKFFKVNGGSFTRLYRTRSIRIQSTKLHSVSFFLSLTIIDADLRIGNNCTQLQSLDGLQNVRQIGGAIDIQPPTLEGNFGRCGALSVKFGIQHTCYARNFRMCVPIFPVTGVSDSKNDHDFIGSTPKLKIVTVPGWYSCLPTVATVLTETPELRTTFGLFSAAGLLDALHTPRADITLFAPTDVAWLNSFGRVGDVLARTDSGNILQVASLHVVSGAYSLFGLRDGKVLESAAVGVMGNGGYQGIHNGDKKNLASITVRSKFGHVFPTAPVSATRCRARPGVSEECAARPTRIVALEPNIARVEDVDTIPDTGTVRHAFDDILLGALTDRGFSQFDADANRFTSETSEPETETVTSFASPNEARTAAVGFLLPSIVVFPDLDASNGVVHLVDAPLVPTGVLLPEPPPAPSTGPGNIFSVSNIPTMLNTPPPPSPVSTTNAPPPVLTPISAYFTVPPSPPSSQWPPPTPPPPGASTAPVNTPSPPPNAQEGSCAARAPNICGLCDYTFSDTSGVCCCDATCVGSGDCCFDYASTCLSGGGARGVSRIAVGVRARG